jgi:hypothetical protein
VSQRRGHRTLHRPSLIVGKEKDIAPLRKYLFLVFLLIGALACGLTTPPASPTANPQSLPTTASTEAPAVATSAEASDTPAPNEAAGPTDTPNPLSQLMPMPFTNMMNASQYLNPVGPPAKSWNGIPIMPEAIAGQEFKPGAVYSFKATATIPQAVSFYKSQMAPLGFSLNGEPGTGSAGTGANAVHNSFMNYYKGSQLLLIYLTSYDNDTSHVIVVISTG